jgi:hypothetical protein
MRITSRALEVWRAVVARAQPTSASDVLNNPKAEGALRAAHYKPEVILDRLVRKGMLTSVVRSGVKLYWFAPGCMAPTGEARPEPLIFQAVATPRTDPARMPGPVIRITP